MDPFNVDRVHERTLELQRTADQVHQERDLRSTPTAQAQAAATRSRPFEPRPSSAKVGGCVSAEPTT